MALLIHPLLYFLLECAAECLSWELFSKVLGTIGVSTVLILTLGRASCEVDEGRSILLGGVVVVARVGLLVMW